MRNTEDTSKSYKNIVIFGFMGTGKTAVASFVAKRLHFSFIDTDALIEEKAGKTISKIFEEEGEEAFRRMEKEVIKEVASKEKCVIATGGGVVLDKENVEMLKKNGFLVCLFASPEKIYERTAKEGRPLLKGNKKKKILHLLKERAHLYEQFEHKIDTSSASVEEVAEKIISLFQHAESLGKSR